MAISHAFSNTIADATGTVTVWNGATTASVAATAIVRPSDWNSVHNMQFNVAGNTTNATSVSGTDVPFKATGGISIGGSAGSLLFSVAAPVAQTTQAQSFTFGGNTTGGSSTLTASGAVNIVASGALSVGNSGSSVFFSAANQSTQAASYTFGGNTTGGSSTLTAAGAVNIVAAGPLSVGNSGSSLYISAQPDPVMSYYDWPVVLNNTATMSVGGGSSIYVQPFYVPENLSASFIRIPVSMSLATTTFTTGAAAYGSSVAQSNTLFMNFYTMGVGGNSRSLQWFTSATRTWALQISYSGTSNSHSVSYNITVPTVSGGDTNTQMTTTNASASINVAPAGTSDYTAYRYFDIPFAASLSAGNYWMAIQRSSTTAGGSNINLGISALVVTQHNSSIAFPGTASNSSNMLMPFLGSWSTNTLGTTTSSIGAANMTTLASHPRMYFQMHRSA